MIASDHRTGNRTMIPWVLALVALIGINALVSAHSRGRMREVSEEIGLSQIADDAQSLARVSSPLILFSPRHSEAVGGFGLSSKLLLIGNSRVDSVATSLEGAVHGRAPPGEIRVS
jgi:hypothetical protein